MVTKVRARRRSIGSALCHFGMNNQHHIILDASNATGRDCAAFAAADMRQPCGERPMTLRDVALLSCPSARHPPRWIATALLTGWLCAFAAASRSAEIKVMSDSPLQPALEK